MKFNELKTYLPALLSTGVSIELVSAPGRGKSTFVRDTISALSKRDGKPWGLATLFLATQTPPDLMGYVMKGEREINGKMVPISEPTMPLWMFTVDGKPVTDFEHGVLFLDEYGQGEADVKRASAELLLNRQLGPWKLPAGWSVIAASNRSKDRSGVTKSFDFVINRRVEINITDDLESWEQWAFDNKVDPTFITFANQNPQIVFSDGVPEKQGPWCTPRSLVMNAQILEPFRNADGDLPTDPHAVELSSGIIGESAAAQLFAMIRLGLEMPRFEDILAKPEDVKVPSKPDACMLVCYNLAARVSKETAKPIITFMQRMPKEFGITFAKTACRRDHTLIFTKAFEEWAAKNSSLMAQLVDVK